MKTVALLICVVLLLAGCAGSGPPRYAVENLTAVPAYLIVVDWSESNNILQGNMQNLDEDQRGSVSSQSYTFNGTHSGQSVTMTLSDFGGQYTGTLANGDSDLQLTNQQGRTEMLHRVTLQEYTTMASSFATDVASTRANELRPLVGTWNEVGKAGEGLIVGPDSSFHQIPDSGGFLTSGIIILTDVQTDSGPQGKSCGHIEFTNGSIFAMAVTDEYCVGAGQLVLTHQDQGQASSTTYQLGNAAPGN